jgi:hypothetical protein
MLGHAQNEETKTTSTGNQKRLVPSCNYLLGAFLPDLSLSCQVNAGEPQFVCFLRAGSFLGDDGPKHSAGPDVNKKHDRQRMKRVVNKVWRMNVMQQRSNNAAEVKQRPLFVPGLSATNTQEKKEQTPKT